MTKIIELRKAIDSLLKTQTSRVYYQVAPKNAQYPYLVYDFTSSTDDGTLENFTLDVDAWDNKKNTSQLEKLISDVDNKLHRTTVYIKDTVNVTLYRESRLNLLDNDDRIRRRKYVYQARTF